MNYRKKGAEELPQENTAIWCCQTEGCNGWMRDNFAFENTPVCWQCQAPMVRGMKMLPLLVNSNPDQKSLKKGTQIS